MKKKLLALCCLLLTFSCAAACGGKSNTDVSNNGTVSEEGTEELGAITITSGKGEVFPYIDKAKEYLQAGAGANVADYAISNDNQAQGINLTWTCDAENVESYTLRYGVKGAPELEKTEINVGKAKRYKLYNLYKGTEYEWTVTANLSNGKKISASESFTTTSLGPRVMDIDGIYNTRDLGGYQTSSGKITKQGLLYRGGALTPYISNGRVIYPSELTEEGKIYMSETLGIKTDLDLRGWGAESGNLQESPIPNAELVYIMTGGYGGAFDLKENFRKVFSLMADKSNYPMYFHCTGGADRTGTVAFLVNALLGVSEVDLIHDYEFTTFSIYGQRNTQQGEYSGYFQDFITRLKSFDGDTLAEKTENYMLSIGVTETEIYNIRAIMLGEETQFSVSVSDTYNAYEDGDFSLTLSNVGEDVAVQEIVFGEDYKPAFSTQENVISVSSEILQTLPNGEIIGKIILQDGREKIFSFICNNVEILSVNAYLPLTNGELTLTATNDSVLGNTPLGYGKTIKMQIKTDVPSGANGGWWIAIGSYAMHLRAGSARMWTTTDGKTFTELAPRAEIVMDISVFQTGATVYYSVEALDDAMMRATLTVVDALGAKQTISYDFDRIAAEIASENASLALAVRSDGQITSLIVKNS